MRRYSARVDDNQKAIAEGLRAAGASVQFLHAVGKGCPDLLVGFKNKNFLFEVKNLAALRGKAQAGQLTAHEKIWHSAWRGQVAVVTTLQQALDVLNPPNPGLDAAMALARHLYDSGHDLLVVGQFESARDCSMAKLRARGLVVVQLDPESLGLRQGPMDLVPSQGA